MHKPPAVVLALATALTVLATAPPSASAQERLTLEEAIALARANNPGLQITLGDETVAEWDVRAAMGSLLPSANVSSGVTWQGPGEQRFGSLTAGQLGFGDQPSYYFSSYNLGLNYSLSGATLRAPARARASRAATEARSRDAEAVLVHEVTRGYLDLLRQAETVTLVEAQLERAQANLRLAEGQEIVGAASMLDVRQAEIQVGRAEVAVLRAEQGLRTARLALLQRMGIDLDREIVPATTFEVEPVGWDEDELFALAIERSPALEALRASRSAAAVGVQSARSAYYPSLSIQAGWSGFTRRASSSDFILRQLDQQEQQLVTQCQFQNELFRRLAEPMPEQDCEQFFFTDGQRSAALAQNRQFPFDFTRQPPQVSLTVSLPIFQGLTRQRELESARLQRDNADYRLREQELAVRVEIATLLSAAQTALQAADLEARNQEVAEAQLSLARAEFELGSIAFLQLAEAETGRAQADMDHLEAVFEYHEAVARLESVVGARLR